MKRVMLRIQQRTSRVPFRPGAREAILYEIDADDIETGAVAYTTRGHETWADAARRALTKADREGWEVLHRSLIERKIASETQAP
jgi:hypothetical protein